MKKHYFFLILLILMPIVFFSSCAEQREYNIGIPKGFFSAQSDEDLSELAEIIGVDKKELKNYFKEDRIVLMAVNSDNSVQIKLSCFENDYSKAIGSFEFLKTEEINNYAAAAVKSKYEIVKNHDNSFIYVQEHITSEDKEYISSRYITVKNDKFYVLSCYNTGGTQDKAVKNVFNSLEINSRTAAIPVWQTILISLGIALFTAAAFGIIISFINDRKAKEQ